MASVEFLRPRLRGARFADGEIPLQVLADLTALREMILEVAKWRYISENPSRQRVPRGFADRIDLKLTGLGDGSAVPIISITTTDRSLEGTGMPYQEFFELARDDIASVIATESGIYQIPNGKPLPNQFLAYFNRIGRSLRDGESLEFPMPNGSGPARLTRESRMRLLQRSTITELAQEVTLRGVVPEADHIRMTFELQQIHGGKTVCPMPEQHHETIIAAFQGYRDNTKILVQGIGRYDRQNRLSSLESVEQVTLLETLDVPARLDELRTMRDGWLDGVGRAPSSDGLNWLSASFENYFSDDLPLPNVYPTPEGGIEAEWSLGTVSIILEFDLDTHQGHWLRFHKESDEEDSQGLDLENSMEWEWLTGEIRRITGDKQ